MHLKNLGNSVNAISDINNVFTSMENFSNKGKNAETIRRLQDITSKYSDEVIKLASSQMTLTKEQATAIFTAKELSGAELDAAVKAAMLSAAQKKAATSTFDLGAAFKGLRIFIKQAAVSMVKFLTQTPVGWATLVIAAFAAVVIISDKLNESLEETKERLSDLQSEIQDSTQKVSSLTTELESVRAKIEEINSLDGAQVVKAGELKELLLQEASLERQIALEKERQALITKEATEAAGKVLSSTSQSEINPTVKKTVNVYDRTNTATPTEMDVANMLTPTELLREAVDETARLETELDSLIAQKEKIKKANGEESDEYKQLVNDIGEVTDAQDKAREIAIKQGKVVEDTIEGIDQSSETYKTGSDALNYYANSLLAAKNATDKLNEASDASVKKGPFSFTEENNEAIDDYQKKINSLGNALSSLKEGKTVDLTDLIQEFPELANRSTSLENAISSLISNSLKDILSLLGDNPPENLKNSLQALADQAQGITKPLDEAFSAIQKSYDALKDFKDAMSGKGLTDSVLSSIGSLSGALNDLVAGYYAGSVGADELFSALSDHYNTDLENYGDALISKNLLSSEFYNAVGLGNKEVIDSFADNYGVDISNCKNYNQAKTEIEKQTLDTISEMWSKYYNAQSKSLTKAGQALEDDVLSGAAINDPAAMELYNKLHEQTKAYEDAMNALNQITYDKVGADFSKISSDIGKNGSGKDKKEKEPTIFDWIAVAAEQSEKKIEKLQNKLNDTSGWKPKNTITDTTIDEMANKLTSLQAMADSYQKAADSYDLSPTYIDKIKNGTLEIESVTDEVIAKNIKNYQEWYNKAEDMRKQIDETKRSMKELAQSKLDNIINDFNSLTSLMGKYTDYLSGLLDLQDSLGESISDTDYRDLIDQQEAIYNQLQNKYNMLNAELKNAVDSGAIEVGSEEWRKYNEELIDVNSSMRDAVSSMNEFRQSILNLSFKELDAFADKIDRINQGTNTLLNILGDDGLMDNGMITAKGLAQLALYGQQYANAKQQAAEYANAIDALNDMYHNGSITEAEYNERLNEYTSAQLSAVEATKEAERAILQFRYDAIQAQIDDMTKLIDAKKKALQAEKDYQDYLKSISNKQNDINNLQKKIDELALSSDRRDIAQRLELEKQLSDAKKELSDLEADYSYDQTMEGLDKEAEEYEEAKNNELKELKESYEKQQEVIKKYLSQVKDNYETVYKTLTEYGINYNVSMTDELTNPWSSADNAVNSFTDAVSSAVSQINIEISNIDLSRLTELIDMMNEFSDTAHGMGGAGSSNYEDATGRGSWKKAADGKRWWYGNSADDFVSDGIYTINGKQYGFDENGYMQTEWQNHNGDYYYFDANNGHMIKSQWIPGNDGKQYYLTADGTMATDMAIKDKKDGDKYYYVDEDGVWDGETINYEEVKDRDLKVGYKNGTKNATPGWHPVNENGFEYVLTKEGTLASFGGGEKVFSNEMSNKLWELAANPAQFIMEASKANLSNMRLDKNAAYTPVEITGPLVVVHGGLDSSMKDYLDSEIKKVPAQIINEYKKACKTKGTLR